jgi:hypothetical protein
MEFAGFHKTRTSYRLGASKSRKMAEIEESLFVDTEGGFVTISISMHAKTISSNLRAVFKNLRHVTLITILLAAGCSESEQSVVPANSGPATFVGSSSCQSCHEAEYRDWIGSHHELAMQIADADTVLGDFDDVSFDYFGTSTQFFTRDDGFYVRTADASGEDREFRIAYAFGVEPLQQYLIEFPGGRLQTLAFTWDTRPQSEGGQRWFHQYPDEYIAPDDELHWTGLQQNWNYMCAECHSTDLQMGFDAASDTFNTTYSEISVGCEACHGPGSKHIERVNADADSGAQGFDVDLDDHGRATWVMNPDTGIAERSELRTA